MFGLLMIGLNSLKWSLLRALIRVLLSRLLSENSYRGGAFGLFIWMNVCCVCLSVCSSFVFVNTRSNVEFRVTLPPFSQRNGLIIHLPSVRSPAPTHYLFLNSRPTTTISLRNLLVVNLNFLINRKLKTNDNDVCPINY